MAYTHQKQDVSMTVGTSTIDMTSTGDKARWAPAFYPVYVRAAVIFLNASPGDAGVVKGDKRPTFGSDSSRGDGDVFVINLATTHAAGALVYKKDLNVKINPGQEVVVEVTDASASVNAAKVSLIVEPAWDIPGNFTAMVATT